MGEQGGIYSLWSDKFGPHNCLEGNLRLMSVREQALWMCGVLSAKTVEHRFHIDLVPLCHFCHLCPVGYKDGVGMRCTSGWTLVHLGACRCLYKSALAMMDS